MSRLLALSLVTCLIGLSSGCAMCCAPFDYDYLVTGGRWTRFNPSSGRVGSAFDEAGAPSDVVVATATGEPTPAQPMPAQSMPTPTTPRQPGYGSQTMAPRQPMRMIPGGRSVIPRDMGNTYLPSGE
ncbi:MAG: hypothetical protein JF612_10065 [Planctomycetia bacterium]|jgi:hypothetical protein|nr:hypothetical protein [Planctomycetia bacterium]